MLPRFSSFTFPFFFFFHFKLSCAIALKRWKRYDSGSFYRWAGKNYGWTRIEVGVNPLCLFVTRTLTRFLNECYPGCSGCMPGRLPYRSLPSYSSTRLFFRGFSSNRDKKYASPFVFFLARRRRGKKETAATIVSSIECWNCCSRFRSSLFFDKISLLVRRDEKICQFFLPFFFFFSPFPINFNSSFRKHLFYVIASNV